MLTRRALDEKLPPTKETIRLAERMTGLDLSEDLLGRGLRWLAELTERDRFAGFHPPAWKTPQEYEHVWSINVWGLSYKDSGQYLTAEGYPLDTTCWYVRIECGCYYLAMGDTPESAVVRALIIACLLLKEREIHPDKRVHILEMLEYTEQDVMK